MKIFKKDRSGTINGIKENIGIYPSINGNAGAMCNAVLYDESLSDEEREKIFTMAAELSDKLLKTVNRRITQESGPIASLIALSHCILSIQTSMLEDSDWKNFFDGMNQQFSFITLRMGGNDEGNKGYA